MAKRKINFGKIAGVMAKLGMAGLVLFGITQCISNEFEDHDAREIINGAVKHRDDGVDYRVRGAHVVEAEYPDQTLTYNFHTKSVLIEHKQNSSFDQLTTFADMDGQDTLREAFENGCRIAIEEMIPLTEHTMRSYRDERAEISTNGAVFARSYCHNN